MSSITYVHILLYEHNYTKSRERHRSTAIIFVSFFFIPWKNNHFVAHEGASTIDINNPVWFVIVFDWTLYCDRYGYGIYNFVYLRIMIDQYAHTHPTPW